MLRKIIASLVRKINYRMHHNDYCHEAKYQLRLINDLGCYNEMQRSSVMLEATEQTGWKIRVRKATTVPSRTIQTINATLKQASAERRQNNSNKLASGKSLDLD